MQKKHHYDAKDSDKFVKMQEYHFIARERTYIYAVCTVLAHGAVGTT